MALSERYGTALVTGAGSGLGAACARMLLSEGVRVWGTSRAPERLESGNGLHPVRMELTDPDSIDDAWTEVEKASGGIDLLVNNAGGGHFGRFMDVPPQDWERQIGLLLLGPVRLCRHALPEMAGRGRGCIVNVTSLAVDFPLPFMTGYDAGKAGLAGFGGAFAFEADEAGVTVIDFRPGDYRTGFNRAMSVDTSRFPPGSGEARAWRRLEALVDRAPEPASAAWALRRALLRGRGGVVRCGSFFQATAAPFLRRLVPETVSRWLHRRYFRLG